MERCLCCVTLSLLLALGLLETNAFKVEIKDGSNDTCIYSSMKVNFTIEYETNNGTYKNVTFAAPDNVTTDGSSCGKSGEAPLLNVHFGNGHSWSLNFTKTDTDYRSSVLSFTYNTNDSKLFQDAKKKGLLSSATNTSFFVPVPLNATYKCLHEDTVITENVVQLYWDVALQAYVENSTFSDEVHCSADLSTPSPSTTPNTTIPSTTATPPKPTTIPVDNPAVGNYSVSNGSGICLLASMGLQLNASLLVGGKIVWTAFNINPNTTGSSGSCGNETAILTLTDNTTVVEFHFSIKSKSFHLQEVDVSLLNGSGISSRTNVNLSLWEASLENSYLCRKEQLLTISEDLYINTFEVRVQPFNVHNATYSTAEECFADSDLSFLIPIAVGTVLVFLIILVFISYLIGRRKSRTGYQSV